MRAGIVGLVLVVAACGTPQEQCIQSNTRELRTVERLIAEVEGNLARGYAIQSYEVPTIEWVPCYPARPGKPGVPVEPRMCPEQDYELRERNVPIDPLVERRKLDGLKARQAQLLRKAQSVIAQCKALYPENG